MKPSYEQLERMYQELRGACAFIATHTATEYTERDEPDRVRREWHNVNTRASLADGFKRIAGKALDAADKIAEEGAK